MMLAVLGMATIFASCEPDNGGSEGGEQSSTTELSIAGVSPSYLSVSVNIKSVNLTNLAYIVEENGSVSHEEYSVEDVKSKGTTVKCSATGLTRLTIKGLTHNTKYDLYVVGYSDTESVKTVIHKEFSTKLVEKFAVMNKTYSSISAYFVYPEGVASGSIIKYATPDVVLYNYYGGEGTEDRWLNEEGGKNILTKTSEFNITLSGNTKITPGQPIYVIFGEYAKSGESYTANFGEANSQGFLYKELVMSEKPGALPYTPEVTIDVKPSGKGSITITPSSSIGSYYYMVVSEEKYDELVKLMNKNASYMQWFVSSDTAQSLFGSKKATEAVTIDTSTLGLQQGVKYRLLITSWNNDEGASQSYLKREFSLPAAAPVAADNIVVAHRGGSKEAGRTSTPDNSLASLRYAKSLKCYASETDIYWTKDNQIVVAHADGDIKINGKYPWESTLEELRKNYKLSNGEKLPTLQEYLAEAMTYGSCTKVWLDLKNCYLSSSKPGHTYVANACKYACEIIKEMEAEPWVEFICTGYSIKQAIPYAKEAGIPIGAMGNNSVSTLKNYGYTWENLDINQYVSSGGEAAAINKYVNEGIALSIYTIDDAATMETYAAFKSKLKGVTTNYPAKFKEQLTIK